MQACPSLWNFMFLIYFLIIHILSRTNQWTLVPWKASSSLQSWISLRAASWNIPPGVQFSVSLCARASVDICSMNDLHDFWVNLNLCLFDCYLLFWKGVLILLHLGADKTRMKDVWPLCSLSFVTCHQLFLSTWNYQNNCSYVSEATCYRLCSCVITFQTKRLI